MKLKKGKPFSIMLFFLLFTILAGCSMAMAKGKPRLPEIEGWEIVSEEFRELKSPKAHLGWFIQQYILSPENKGADVILLTGDGPGKLYVPPGEISQDDRPIGFGATYETMTIGEFRAIMEYYPYQGFSLSINIPSTGTLIIESGNLSKENIIKLGAEYLEQMDLPEQEVKQ